MSLWKLCSQVEMAVICTCTSILQYLVCAYLLCTRYVFNNSTSILPKQRYQNNWWLDKFSFLFLDLFTYRREWWWSALHHCQVSKDKLKGFCWFHFMVLVLNASLKYRSGDINLVAWAPICHGYSVWREASTKLHGHCFWSPSSVPF